MTKPRRRTFRYWWVKKSARTLSLASAFMSFPWIRDVCREAYLQGMRDGRYYERKREFG